MKSDRRKFLKTSAMAGLGMAGGIKALASLSESSPVGSVSIHRPRAKRFNMSGYAAPPLEKVRIGIIGMGQRGPAHMITMSHIEGTEIKALCDVRPEKASAAKERLKGTGHDPVLYTNGPEDWKKMCERDDIDLVIVTTPWYMHTEMAVYAMEHGKHAASEVPAAATLEECWLLVETAERTRKHCMMTENYAYMPFQLLTLNMARKGFFGELVHGDCAYNTSKIGNNFRKNMYWDMWWLRQYASRHGNIYPTHGLGPIAQMMNINRGDKFEFLVSVESKDFMMHHKAVELAAGDPFFEPFTKADFRGNMSVTTIRTTLGRTITIQHDATSPSPHNLIHGIYGTKGSALYDPQPPKLCKGDHKWASPEEFSELEKQFTPKISIQVGELSKQIGAGHGGSDLFVDWHLIDCLRNGLPLDQDVYDAAAWSSILPLSQWSVLNRSNSVDVPDFTRGDWLTNKPNMDIELERGGTTGVIV